MWRSIANDAWLQTKGLPVTKIVGGLVVVLVGIYLLGFALKILFWGVLGIGALVVAAKLFGVALDFLDGRRFGRLSGSKSIILHKDS